jgi:multiple sugar transport system ATP-binding protein
MRARERDLAMVFQSQALYPRMTVADNMRLLLRLQGVPKANRAARVARAARILGLDGMLDRHPRDLSGGQRQRVAMGRAIVRNPRARLGTTTIYVTHDQTEAMTMADRIVILRAGRVEQIGAPLAVHDDPGSVFVAGFIGTPEMNL